jgi:hypothetical protein
MAMTETMHGKETCTATNEDSARQRTKKPLPLMALPCDLYRAVSHNKNFAVCTGAFAVQIVARQSPAFP